MKKLLLLTLLGVLTITLSACNNKVDFFLLGEEVTHMTTGDAYTEMGFMARANGDDISQYVTFSGDVNPSEAGDYTISYTLEYKGDTTTLERRIYYREEGCQAIDGTNLTECSTVWSEYLHTVVKLRVYYEDDDFHDVMHLVFDNVEMMLEKYNDLSDKYALYDNVINVKTINDNPTTTHTIRSELFELIEFALDHQDEVDNRFNIALGPVLQIWHNYREDCNNVVGSQTCAVPTMTELQAADLYTDPSDITLDETNLTITMKDNMSIDLGGVSKGFISGKIIDYLDGIGLYGYLLNNGESNISIGGTHPVRENGKFLLAITDPTFATSYYATVFLGDGDQLVTSGDYQQYYMVGDDVYHHIINPMTLMPDRTMRSVSIVTSDPALADLYSTAIFTMPVSEGLTFVNNIDGLEAIWYQMDNTVMMSDNFETMYLDELYLD